MMKQFEYDIISTPISSCRKCYIEKNIKKGLCQEMNEKWSISHKV